MRLNMKFDFDCHTFTEQAKREFSLFNYIGNKQQIDNSGVKDRNHSNIESSYNFVIKRTCILLKCIHLCTL